MRKFLFCAVAMLLATFSNISVAWASENDILDEIIAAQEEYDRIRNEEIMEIEEFGIPGDRNALIKTQVTCYIEAGKKTSTGSLKMDKIIAASPEYVGRVAQVYKVDEDGGIGDFIGYFEVADTGYGAPTGYGKSIYPGKKSAGTIEMGLTVDFRKPNMNIAKAFMLETYTGGGTTGSEVYISLEDGEG